MATNLTVRLRRSTKIDDQRDSHSASRNSTTSSSNQSGFALVAVIWSLGVITLLGTAVIVGARYRTKVTSSYASVAAATEAAESAINLGIMATLTAAQNKTNKFPLRCQLPSGEQIAVTLEDEAGKVDLNTASPAVLTRLFAALTHDPSDAKTVVDRILEFREPQSGGVAKPHFTTIMQLDQIEGISPRLFRTALRFVTVRSGRSEPDTNAATPVLRQLLNLDSQSLEPEHSLPTTGSITIRADIKAPDGTRFVREALISLGENGRPFSIREWRHGDLDLAVPAKVSSSNEASSFESKCFIMSRDAAES